METQKTVGRRQGLQDKAIDIKGKKYILVSDRVLEFHYRYPQGSITTKLVSGVLDDQL